ncbi:MAG: tRNA pseudouridine(38-40) synthase TruA [Bacilli bacterium]|jgi:tRNA pseudouridine38-40 synthase|nr:tRNA pseudouridine(38-40) synthase TruA [Bacilli bacterium]
MLFSYKLIFSYDGSDFLGMEKQTSGRTVQEEMEKVLSRIANQEIKLIYASRTDKKVHALNQVAIIKSNKELNIYHFLYATNLALPKDIHIKSMELVDDNFHPRYQAKGKHYQYIINLNEYDPLLRNRMLFINKELNINLMQEASKLFIGKKDFRSFSSVPKNKESVREIYDIIIANDNNIITIDFYGNGFLRYMIRKIVSILIDVSLNKKSLDDINELFEKKDISAYSKIVPSIGLYLMEVYYD